MGAFGPRFGTVAPSRPPGDVADGGAPDDEGPGPVGPARRPVGIRSGTDGRPLRYQKQWTRSCEERTSRGTGQCYQSVMRHATHLTDRELLAEVVRLAGHERRATVALIVHLGEL